MKFTNKRKILENIPNDTFYCYTPDDEKDTFYIKPCKYYKHKKSLLGKCKLYKCEVIDLVKECGLKIPR